MKVAELNKVFIERRRGPDVVVKAVWWTVGISWILIIATCLITSEALPKFETFIDRMVEVPVRGYMDKNVLRYAYYVLITNFVVCLVGFILNILRHKRKTDKISKSILVLGVITLVGILWYMIRFIF